MSSVISLLEFLLSPCGKWVTDWCKFLPEPLLVPSICILRRTDTVSAPRYFILRPLKSCWETGARERVPGIRGAWVGGGFGFREWGALSADKKHIAQYSAVFFPIKIIFSFDILLRLGTFCQVSAQPSYYFLTGETKFWVEAIWMSTREFCYQNHKTVFTWILLSWLWVLSWFFLIFLQWCVHTYRNLILMTPYTW